MGEAMSEDINFYGLLYDRSQEFEQRKRHRERKMRKRMIAEQRYIAYDIHGCAEIAEKCTFPECMCYPYWRSKYRNKIAQKQLCVMEDTEDDSE